MQDQSIRDKMGQYQLLGKETKNKIPDSRLVELNNVGHLPHIEAFNRFIEPLVDFLRESYVSCFLFQTVKRNFFMFSKRRQNY